MSDFDSFVDNARRHLVSLRDARGHWEGLLASSALSTATAVMALEGYLGHDRAAQRSTEEISQIRRLIEGGRHWLAEHQNQDGGWGDTIKSFSNISTTALGWAAMAGCAASLSPSEKAAEAWLERQVGSLEPAQVAEAIRQRYGKDRTFSVPILTALAITGRLGPEPDAWRQIPPLPFELAACPRQWFARLKLPVVSYALPALIAMGQARFRALPSRNPIIRFIRSVATQPTLRVLQSIQPQGGGFLEATPLTSFVVMSLIRASHQEHPVVENGVDFLLKSVRPDGSWPIDTHLATWVTTLSLNALRSSDCLSSLLDDHERIGLRDWLLAQQYRTIHPYTQAAPGGWSWTPLPGGVPDADDTPGALLALRAFEFTNEIRSAAQMGVRWLLDLQNGDGGIPTFCRGWGTLPFDRSSPDLTAHAIRAWLAWKDDLSSDLRHRLDRHLTSATNYLLKTQHSDGSWAPLWFGNQHASSETNRTYGTSRVLLALVALAAHSSTAELLSRIDRSIRWLVEAQNEDGGWGGEASTPSSIEETALAIEAIADVGRLRLNDTHSSVLDRGVQWLARETVQGTRFEPSPIGFYFAKLWYFEQLYPVVYTVAALEKVRRFRESAITEMPQQRSTRV